MREGETRKCWQFRYYSTNNNRKQGTVITEQGAVIENLQELNAALLRRLAPTYVACVDTALLWGLSRVGSPNPGTSTLVEAEVEELNSEHDDLAISEPFFWCVTFYDNHFDVTLILGTCPRPRFRVPGQGPFGRVGIIHQPVPLQRRAFGHCKRGQESSSR